LACFFALYNKEVVLLRDLMQPKINLNFKNILAEGGKMDYK
jgi:hypothetical protein